VLDESFLLLFNAHHEDCAFTLPDSEFGEAWTVIFDTAVDGIGEDEIPAGAEVDLVHHSLVLLRRVSE
jgi:glycogen operon protein